MAVLQLMDMTWTEVAELDRQRLVAILPIGAVEAHGPHLPLSTDHIISRSMAENGARRLAEQGLEVLLLPALDYTAASFGAAFPGTISVRPTTVVALLEDLARSLARHGVRWLAIANSHLDPVHLDSLYAGVSSIAREESIEVVFPDICRKPWALRLTDEFKSGACHAGRFESSIVMRESPELVREARRRELTANPSSLSEAIRSGLESFEEAGGPLAYFGDPASATVEEGHSTIETLGQILAEAILDVLPQPLPTAPLPSPNPQT